MKKSDCIQQLPEGGYVFCVFPSNNNNQKLGQSAIVYANEKECRQALDDFIDMVAMHKLKAEDGTFIKVKKEQKVHNNVFGTYRTFHFFDESGNEIFRRTVPYSTKTACDTGIAAVIKQVKKLK